MIASVQIWLLAFSDELGVAHRLHAVGLPKPDQGCASIPPCGALIAHGKALGISGQKLLWDVG